MPRETSIQRITFLGFLGIIFLFSLFLTAGLIFEEYQHFNSETVKYEDEFMRARQDELQREVMKIIRLIDFQRNQQDQQNRDELRERVIDAMVLARGILRENGESLPLAAIKDMVAARLGEIRFDNGMGYYFAGNGETGIEYVAEQPEFAGQKLESDPGSSSEDLVRNMVAMVGEQEETYLRYQAPKPRRKAKQLFDKLSFVKYFEPFDWYIGSGIYLDDRERGIQAQILGLINNLQYEPGAISVFRDDGTILYHDRKECIGRAVNNLGGTTLAEIYRKLLRVSGNSGGGYVLFEGEKAEEGDSGQKMAFARRYPDWQWIITMEMFADDMKGTLRQKKLTLADQVRGHMFKIIFIFAMTAVFAVLLSHILSRRLEREFKVFTRFFQAAASGHEEIDRTNLTIREFKDLAASANHILEELRDNEKLTRRLRILLANIIDSMPSILIGVDQDGRVIQWNRQAEEVTGLNAHKARGARLDTVFPQLAGQLDMVGKAIRERTPCIKTAVAHEQNGMTSYANVEVYPLVGDGGDGVDGAVIRIDDVTRQVEAEQERTRLITRLQQAQKMEALGSLAGGIAHDFNNILTPILGYTEMVLDQFPHNAPGAAYLEEVLKAGGRAKDLVRQILSFSRQSGQNKQAVRLQQIVGEALNLLRASIPSTIEINRFVAPGCGEILADPIQIHQVLMNLCTNAYHAMRAKGGMLTVSVTPVEITMGGAELGDLHLKPGSYLKLEVSDTGEGMDKGTRERIFDPYFTTKKADEGTGMGLPVVHGIVKNHGGYITVTSEPGGGSTFTVYLPRLTAEASDLPEEAAETIPCGSERILIVDDEEVIVMMMRKMLEDLGYRVSAFTSSTTALEYFSRKSDEFDLIITDMTMPQLTGAELAVKILEQRPDMAIILCTGFSELCDEEKVKILGIRHYIMKPIIKRELGLVVRMVLDGGSFSRQNKGPAA